MKRADAKLQNDGYIKNISRKNRSIGAIFTPAALRELAVEVGL